MLEEELKELFGREIDYIYYISIDKIEEYSMKNNSDNVNIMSQSLDENGIILDVTKEWIDKTGYTREEVIGKFFGDFLDEASLP